MSWKFDIKSLGAGAVAGAALVLSIGAATQNAGERGWEYRVIAAKPFLGELEKGINASAADGWEFVTASDMSAEQFAFAVMRRPRR